MSAKITVLGGNAVTVRTVSQTERIGVAYGAASYARKSGEGWKLIGTMTSADEYTVDLTGCTELAVVVNGTGTGNATLMSSAGALCNNVVQSGQRLSYLRFADCPAGF